MNGRKGVGRHSHGTGFTLVELLVVIGIIALLISILLPALSKATQAARTVTCAARLRDLTTMCLLYVNDNHGFLPPIAAGGDPPPYSGTGYRLGRPTIFPQGTSDPPSTLWRYLSVNPASPTQIGVSAAKLFVCPELIAQSGYDPTKYYSYRYSQILGGFDAKRAYADPSNPGGDIYVPWRLNQVKSSAQQALILEGDLQVAGNSPTVMSMGWVEDIAASSGTTGNRYQYPEWGLVSGLPANPATLNVVHQVKNLGIRAPYTLPVMVGVTNIACCDGHVMTLRVRVNDPSQAPLRKMWPGVFFDPYHPQPIF